MEEKVGLSVYVTHSNFLTIKLVSSQFAKVQAELPVLATYDNKKYTLHNTGELTSRGVDCSKTELNLDEFTAVINKIKALDIINPNVTMVCCDANLGTLAGHTVTPDLNNLLAQVRPNTVALFISTPECELSAQAYLNGSSMEDGLHIPLEVAQGFVADRAKLTEVIATKQFPQLIRETHGVQNEVSNISLNSLSTEISEELNSFPPMDISQKEKNKSFINKCKQFLNFSKNNGKIAPVSEEDNSRPPDDNKPKPG